ncbi:MAG: extracellular solute-binding protein [Clostridium luticellarii]|jgi:multiple sugar transport system substrate-binding protein|uniref:Putative arabinose-binding protein n=1 Tax=Clostridium luticellarii TaxID=1691940 RepID=A0A2T0BK86_9CLOT|nr:extracellular solute-binding protein [Clostridium luticellarii]MCI2039446.1 extracellular solute-binding protein [Clostridium luticellarii]PRR84243.1 putative arabinose-binding protein precursor [Clostridium luticellarii]
MNRALKTVLFLILTVTLILTISCDAQDNEENNKNVPKGNIEVVTDVEHGSQLKLAASRFNDIHKNVNVNVVLVRDTDNNIKPLLSNSKYTADIITLDDSYVKHTLSKYSDGILKITDSVNLYKNALLNNKMNNNTMKGGIYALPWDTYPKALIYRKDIFAKEDVDINSIKTWSDYIEIGRKIKNDTGKVFMGNVSDYNSDIFLLLANQLGTSYFNESGKLEFQSQKWSRVMEIAKIFYGEDLIEDFNSKSDLIGELSGGKVVSFIGDPTYVNLLMKKYPKDGSKWGVMKFPAFEPGGNRDVSLGGTNLIINKKTKQPDLAQDFINFVLTDDRLQMDLLNDYGRFPTNVSVYNLVDLNKQITYFGAQIWNLYAEVEQGSFIINYTRDFPEIREKIRGILTESNVKSQDFKNIVEGIEKSLKNDMGK